MQHLVGYAQAEKALVGAQRRAVMLCLRRLARPPGAEEKIEPRRSKRRKKGGGLDAGRAVQAYEKGGDDVWSVILAYAF
jgi:hypothetical protein